MSQKTEYIAEYIRPLKILGCLPHKTYENFREVYHKLEKKEESTKCKTNVKAFLLNIVSSDGRPTVLRHEFVSYLMEIAGCEISTEEGLKNFNYDYYTKK